MLRIDKKYFYPFIVLIIIVVVLTWLYFQNNSIETTYDLTVGQVAEISGVVIKNNISQELDTSESLLIRTDHDQVYRVIYLYGLKECENRESAASLRKNIPVTIRGIVIEPDTISTCESKGFYIDEIE